ncbi:amino acid adenylation domain-containing protein [Streptomyces sp. NPDC001941]|uniref:non-ribosomal peptide synthetase n=1 Tax=Streptomyces sp. NPDC001941 TaxID=3154659 RepID=UPI00332F9E08
MTQHTTDEPVRAEQSFPLTAVQQAYRLGQEDGPLGGVACHMYFEFDPESLDRQRLATAVQEVQQRHPMLRARFDDPDEAQVMSEPLAELRQEDRPARRVREEMAVFHPVAEGLGGLDVRVSTRSGGGSRLHVGVALIAADPPSIRTVLGDLASAYSGQPGPAPGADSSGAPAVGRPAERDDGSGPEELPEPPKLPWATDAAEVSGARFTRHHVRLEPPVWERLVERAEHEDVAVEDLLFAAFAHTVDRWSESDDCVLNVPRFDRPGSARDAVGDFSRLTAVQVPLSQAEDLRDVVEKARGALRADSPTVQDVLAWARERGLSTRPLGVVYTAVDTAWAPASFTEVFGPMTWMVSQTPQVYLDCLVYPAYDGGPPVMAWDVVEDVLAAPLVEAMTAYCASMLVALADEDWSRSTVLPLPAAQREARERANSARAEVPDALVHDAFFSHARRDGDAPALFSDDVRWSRAELADAALRVASLLVARGLTVGDPVGVCLADGVDQVRAVLGVLAAGGCYVPISPDQPEERRRSVLKRAGARFVLCDQELADASDGEAYARDVKEDSPAPDVPADRPLFHLPLALARDAEPLEQPVTAPPDSPAYIIFTSGSTGQPKGVEVSHRSALNSILDLNRRWGVGERDRCLPVSSLDFDLSVYEIFGPLVAGGAVVIAGVDEHRDPEAWIRLMNTYEVTVWDSVPVLLDALLTQAEETEAPRSLRVVMTGGDWVPLDLPGRLRDLLPQAHFVACGGATEGSIYSNYFEVKAVEEEWTSIPYGYPLANQQYRVVDSAGRDCPDDVPGEMWIGGMGVATGYRNDEERTAERFVTVAGRRWYRTGDLGRYRSGAVLEFLGRIDHQVKVNGYRIELGEIESVLTSHDDVARAVALVTDEGASRRIIAYLQPHGDRVDTGQVRETAQQWLPAYAVPEDYLMVPELPLNQNGKIDRKKLAGWAAPQQRKTDEEPVHAGVESDVAALWSELLGLRVTARNVSFYDLGGNSLLSMRLTQRLSKRFDKAFTLRRVQKASTVAELARLVEDAPVTEDARVTADGGTR